MFCLKQRSEMDVFLSKRELTFPSPGKLLHKMLRSQSNGFYKREKTVHHQADAFNINLLIQRILNMSFLYFYIGHFYDVIWLQRPEIILFPYIIFNSQSCRGLRNYTYMHKNTSDWRILSITVKMASSWKLPYYTDFYKICFPSTRGPLIF